MDLNNNEVLRTKVLRTVNAPTTNNQISTQNEILIGRGVRGKKLDNQGRIPLRQQVTLPEDTDSHIRIVNKEEKYTPHKPNRMKPKRLFEDKIQEYIELDKK